MGFGKKLESFFGGKGLEANKSEGSKKDMIQNFQKAVDNPEEKFDGTKDEVPFKVNQKNADQMQRAAESVVSYNSDILSDSEKMKLETRGKTEVVSSKEQDKIDAQNIVDKIKEIPDQAA